MAYSVEISRANPTCFVFLLDQSTSMEDPIVAGGEGTPKRKADAVADALNRLLFELSLKCAKEEGVRDYFHVAVLGYGARIGSAFGGALAGRDLVPLSQVADNPLRVEERAKKVPDGAGGLVETTARFPVWVDPVANGGTPMTQALGQAAALVERWVGERPGSFPPIVINLTDGESTDGDPAEPAARLRSLATADGSVLVFNLHVSAGQAAPIVFPASEANLPDDFARLLFGMSSPLPPHMLRYASTQGIAVGEGSRGFVFNADITSVVQFLDIGTRATDLR
ncbi:MAG TPA: hypothetical protein VFU74_18735 [Actinocrinis sp.]|nr:hypothetical protein [Actinocrinis sp.]